jgi:putative DNA methylase
MSVRTALQLINRVVDAYLNASDDELDADTLFCLNWFDQYGWSQGKFGQAEVLATAKGTTVERMKTSGVLESGQGNVRLLRYQEFQPNWHPDRDNRILGSTSSTCPFSSTTWGTNRWEPIGWNAISFRTYS